MKRDCGRGELVPIAWDVVSCTGLSDDEYETKHATRDEAMQEFVRRKEQAIGVRCSDVRLYARDKQGYANCMLHWSLDVNGKESIRDRMNEL